jgi:hypothetical protein
MICSETCGTALRAALAEEIGLVRRGRNREDVCNTSGDGQRGAAPK